MAITSDKLLNRTTKNIDQKIISSGGPSNVVLTKKSVKDIASIKVNVIKIESILKGTLAAEKKSLDTKKRQESGKRREKQEEKLETKPQAEKGPIKMPKVPRMGFLDWIKNFIGNVILGYFAVRMLKYLPLLKPILKFVGQATDFVLNVGGKLLDGLVTFIDWGYKAYDASRGFIKNLFGENGVKQFDQLSGLLNNFLNLAIIAGMIAAGSGGGGRGGGPGAGTRPRPGQGGRPRVTASGGGGAGRPDIRNPLRQRPTVTTGGKPQFRLPGTGPKITGSGAKGILSSVRPFLKRIPLPVVGALIDFGLSVALGEDPGRAAFRAIGAGLLGAVGAAAGSVVPVAGNFIGGLLGGFAGDAIGGVLYDAFFGGKSLARGKSTRKAGGGVTRGGKTKTGARRTIIKEKKSGKYKRVVSRKPGEVEIKPGADVGGEEKLFGLFPKPKLPDFLNPFKTIENTGKELGKSDYFGPILAITSKILLGQKPNQKDYENVGLGINLLVSKGIQDGQLKGGVAAAFAEGGFVDPETLNAVNSGGDISEWVAASFKDATESNAQKTLRQIQENLRLKKEGDGETGKSTTDESMPEGTGALVGNTNAEKVFNFLKGAGFTEQAAAGVIGNLMQESGVNPKSKQLGGGPGRGIMQWGTGPGSGGRWDALVAWASSSGKDPWSLDTQVEWMMKEMRSYGTYNRLKGVTDVKKSVVIFESEMEKAGVPNYPRRYQYAADALASFGGGKAGGMKDAGEGGVVGGGGNFVQGNSGSSYGVHFHIGPGNQTKGNILQPQYNADARASALKAFMQFVGQRSIYLGRSGVSVPKGKKISSAEASKLIAAEQRAHSASGSQGGIDMQVDFESKVGFPLKTFGLKYRPNGFGVSADISGSNSFVAHGRYDEKGKVGPQEGLRIYGDGGETPGYPHLAILGDKNQREIVIDGDSAGPAKNMLLAINQASGYKGVMQAIQQYAPYDALSPQTIVMESPDTSMDDDYVDSGSSGLAMAFAGGGNDNPFDTLYQGG
jgi:hypothetical protein